jgi:Kef-type K+ transport system membrane component KefB
MEKALVEVSVYLIAVRLGGAICEILKTSPIIGEVIVGAIFGPPLLKFVPYPLGLQLAGILGIQLAVIEAGIQTDMDDLKTLAPRALLIAVLGIILPIVLALAATKGFGGTTLEAFATGSAIAPTSLGVVAKLLKEKNELSTPLGKIISMAAVFDDVLSLILLSFLVKLADKKSTAWDKASPVVFAFIFIFGAIFIANFVPHIINFGLAKISQEQSKGYFVLINLFLFALLLTWLANIAGTSFLLGGYLGGIAFASLPDTYLTDPYEVQVKRLLTWGARLFFAATIAFEIPLKAMFNVDSLGLGAVLALIGVFGKMICGIGTWPNHMTDGLAVGVAMLGRGEFGFLIAAQAKSLDMITEVQYAAAVWGVVVPTFLTPILFGPIFDYRQRRLGIVPESPEGEADKISDETTQGIQA